MLYEKGLVLVDNKRLNTTNIPANTAGWKDLEDANFAEQNHLELTVLTSGEVATSYMNQTCTIKVYTSDSENGTGSREVATFGLKGEDLAKGEVRLTVPGHCGRFINLSVTQGSSSYFSQVHMTVIGRPV